MNRPARMCRAGPYMGRRTGEHGHGLQPKFSGCRSRAPRTGVVINSFCAMNIEHRALGGHLCGHLWGLTEETIDGAYGRD